MNTAYLTRFLSFFAVCYALASGSMIGTACAEDLSAVKVRMSQRLASIDKLKADAKLGEANTGFLAAKGAVSASETALMNAENADRKVVYAAIAKGNKTTPASVGALRAASLRKSSAKGVWLQDTKGKWYKKS